MCLDPKCLTRIHARGNLTYDGRKGVGMSWNILNLASSATLPTGAFSYTWLSDGTKVSARADDGFGARMYDPFTARWTAVDPMSILVRVNVFIR